MRLKAVVSVWVSTLVLQACVPKTPAAQPPAVRAAPLSSSRPIAPADLGRVLYDVQPYIRRGAYSEIVERVEPALQSVIGTPAEVSRPALELWMLLSWTRSNQHARVQALAAARRAVDMLRQSGFPADDLRAQALAQQGIEAHALHRLDEAEPALTQALEAARAVPTEPLVEGNAARTLAALYVETNRAAEALPLLSRARALLEAARRNPGSLPMEIELTLTNASSAVGDDAGARAALERALDLFEHDVRVNGALLCETLPQLVFSQEVVVDELAWIALLSRALRLSGANAPACRLDGVRASLAASYLERGDQPAAREVVYDRPLFARRYLVSANRIDELAFEQSWPRLRKPGSPRRPSDPPPPKEPSPMKPRDGEVANAAQVVAAMRAPFRGCYQEALVRDRSAEALIRLTIQVARDGKVSAVVGASIGADRALVDCTLEVAATGNFSAPQGGSAAIQVPLTLVKR